MPFSYTFFPRNYHAVGGTTKFHSMFIIIIIASRKQEARVKLLAEF